MKQNAVISSQREDKRRNENAMVAGRLDKCVVRSLNSDWRY